MDSNMIAGEDDALHRNRFNGGGSLEIEARVGVEEDEDHAGQQHKRKQ